MATPPDQIRNGLTLITAAAANELRQVADNYAEPQAQSAALFVAAPLIVSEYMDGSSALALDWYEELRDESPARSLFIPQPVTPLREDYIGNVVGWATKPLLDPLPDVLADIEAEMALALAKIEAEIQKEVAAAFRETMVENTNDDPDSVGWRRFARPGACNFCRHLADKGAIFKADTARFAAHTNCHCTAAPVFNGQVGEEADVWQYLASERKRTPKERKALRDYLAKKYGDADGEASSASTDRKSADSPSRDVDADKTLAELEATLASLEQSLARFDSPGTRRRIEDLRRKIRARKN